VLSKLRQFNGLKYLQSLWSNQTDHLFFPGLCSIGITPQEFCLAYARNEGGKIELQFVEIYPYKSTGLTETLSAIVKKHQLEGVRCTWVLPPEHYQSIVIDALPVNESEFQAAARWKIKGALQFPEDDIVIDRFLVPLKKTHDPHPMIAIIAAQASFLQQYATKIQASGLQLRTIDIQELTLKNITSLYENDEKTTALIYLRKSGSELIISCQKELYFHRQIDLTNQISHLDSQAFNSELDKTALELQRSFDYFQSQWRKPSPARILLATSGQSGVSIADYFAQHLAIPIELLDIRSLLPSKQDLSLEEQANYLPMIGGILREEGAQHAATN